MVTNWETGPEWVSVYEVDMYGTSQEIKLTDIYTQMRLIILSSKKK